MQPSSGMKSAEGQRSIPQLMQVLKGVNLRHLAGRHLKAAKLYQAF